MATALDEILADPRLAQLSGDARVAAIVLYATNILSPLGIGIVDLYVLKERSHSRTQPEALIRELVRATLARWDPDSGMIQMIGRYKAPYPNSPTVAKGAVKRLSADMSTLSVRGVEPPIWLGKQLSMVFGSRQIWRLPVLEALATACDLAYDEFTKRQWARVKRERQELVRVADKRDRLARKAEKAAAKDRAKPLHEQADELMRSVIPANDAPETTPAPRQEMPVADGPDGMDGADVKAPALPAPLLTGEPAPSLIDLEASDTEIATRAARIWNEVVHPAGGVMAKGMSPPRVELVKRRLRELGGLNEWRAFCEKIAASPFLTGKTAPRGDRETTFVVYFDWALKPVNFTKIVEGVYDDKGRRGGFAGATPVTAGSRIAAGLGAALDHGMDAGRADTRWR